MKAKYAHEIRTGIRIGREFLDLLGTGNYMAAVLVSRTRLENQPELVHRGFQRTLAKYSY
jgi:hypothetical protein